MSLANPFAPPDPDQPKPKKKPKVKTTRRTSKPK